MRKDSEILSHQISNNTVLSILNEPASPFATHITIPAGISSSEETNNKDLEQAFTLSLNSLQIPQSTTSSTNGINGNQNPKELKFGIPQIDLSLPSGTLAKNGLHEFNPKHYKDQNIAFKAALGLAAREITSGETKPIFCFLTEDQSHLIKWLSSSDISSLGLSKENLVIVTGKHSDDLLWAMEETLHRVESVALVAHFTLLSNIAAQRLSFAAKTKQTPCLLICNHKIEGPNHTQSKWSIWSETPNMDQDQNHSFENERIGLSNSNINKDHYTPKWALKWQAQKGRFTIDLPQSNTSSTPVLH